ncbi:MAG: alcohol dehydrogenase catalytic domain-containing protein [Agriterribacter sp.]
MKAAVIHGAGRISYDTVPDPTIKNDRDIIFKVTATAICGSDLHIYSGGIPQPRPMVLGHEFMGIVEETGKAVTNLKTGDRVVVPFPIACGHCFFCNHSLPGHCENSNPEHYGRLYRISVVADLVFYAIHFAFNFVAGQIDLETNSEHQVTGSYG